MLFKRAVGFVLLAVTCIAVAQQAPRSPKRTQVALANPARTIEESKKFIGLPAPAVRPVIDLMASQDEVPFQIERRRRIPKPPSIHLDPNPIGATGKLIVKFIDEARARPAEAMVVTSHTNQDLSAFVEIIEEAGLLVTPFFSRSPEVLARIEARPSFSRFFVRY